MSVISGGVSGGTPVLGMRDLGDGVMRSDQPITCKHGVSLAAVCNGCASPRDLPEPHVHHWQPGPASQWYTFTDRSTDTPAVRVERIAVVCACGTVEERTL